MWELDASKVKKNSNEISDRANKILKSSVLRLALELGENAETMLSSMPGIKLISSEEDPYIKYEYDSNTLTIVGDAIEEKFISLVINGVIAAYYFQQKQKKRFIYDSNASGNAATEQLLKFGFSTLFNIVSIESWEKPSSLAGNIFKKGELADIQSLKEMLLLSHRNILSGKFEDFAIGILNDGNADSIDLMARVLATAMVLSYNGDTIQALKNMYYNGYASLKHISMVEPERFKQYVDMLFSNNAS